MTLLLALALAAQQDQTAFRTEKGDYLPAIQRCREAQALVDSDPFTAIEILDSVINNPKIRKVECRIRVEERASEYTPWYLFLPYQYRGRAKVNRAGKTQGEAARNLLESAIVDFEKSVRAGVTSSAPLLKNARADLAKLRKPATPNPPPTVDPMLAFRPKWQTLLLDRRFRSAMAYLEKEGGSLADAQRAALKAEAEAECRRFVTRGLVDFRRSLSALRSERDLTIMTDREFHTAFALPPAGELIVEDPGLAWARKHVADLKAVQSREKPGRHLLAAAVASMELVPKDRNPWFLPLADVALGSLKTEVSARIAAARDAKKADRDRLRGEAEALCADWAAALAAAVKVDAKFPERHGMTDGERELAALLTGFPSELAELAGIDVAASFSAASPEAELAKLEETLRGLAARPGVALESRRSVHTRIAAVAALRGLLEGKTEEEVAAGMEGEAAQLKAVGGADDVSAHGPRVAKVFELLLR